MNIWLIIILLGFIIYVYNFMIYNKKKIDVIEYSCKFSKNTGYNDSRFIKMFYSDIEDAKEKIFDKYGTHPMLMDFYYKIKNKVTLNKIVGIIIGFDKEKSIEKIYLDTDKTIIGMELNLNNQKKNFRKYVAKKFEKESLDKFIGKGKSDIICNFLKNYTDNLKLIMIYNKHIGDSIEYINMNNVVSKHICFLNLSKKIYISNFKEQLTKIINLFKCNTNGLDEWLKKNENKQIAWIGLTKVENDNVDVTIYYRD